MHLLLCLLDHLDTGSLNLNALDIYVTHKITALKHHEIVGHDGCVINLQILPFGSKGNVFICTGIPITKFAMQCSLLRTTYRNGHLVILIHIQGDIIYHYELNIP